MAKLPDANVLGGLSPISSARPISQVDIADAGRRGSGAIKGIASIEKGAQTLASGVQDLGAADADVEVLKANYQRTQANAKFLSDASDLDAKYANDTNYQDIKPRYEADLAKLRDEAAGTIENPTRRERFASETSPAFRHQVNKIKARARSLEKDANVGYLIEQGDKLASGALQAPDEETRSRFIQNYHDLVDDQVAQGYLTKVQGLERKQAWATHFATADYLAAINSGDPNRVQAAVNRLRLPPGSPETITDRIQQVEGSGKDPRSSAVGGMIDETWLALLKRERPELAAGKSDAELLTLRADRGLLRAMTEANRADNESYLRKQGIAPTPGNQYLAHFLGPAGAAAVLKADPNAPIEQVLSQAVGAKKARAMIEANPTILNGQLAGSVAQWAAGKMGGDRHISEVLHLQPDVRERLLGVGQDALRKLTADDLTGFKTRMQDTISESMNTGDVVKPMGQGEFIAALGAEVGPRAYQSYQAELQLGRDVNSVARLDPQEQERLFRSYEPKPGSAGYAEQAKRYEALGKAIDRVNTEARKDPAAFAIARLPVVQEAYAKFSAAQSDATVPLADKQAAAREFATKMEMEQARVGVPAEARRLLPKNYADQFNARLSNPAAGGGTLNLVTMIDNEAKIWGDNWPKVYRELAKDAQPVVRVIGSGVRPAAAQLLAEFAHTKLGDIANDQSEEKLSTIRKDVRDAFRPLSRSMAGNEGAQPVIDSFQIAGEKLAAFYVRGGQSSADAARRAFDELLGHKYDFSGETYRVPKTIPFTPAQIASGVAGAKDNLDKLDVLPARDTIGGLTPEYLKTATARAYARDGVWVTAPDESGLALIYQDQAVRRADGKPLVLSWEQLGRLGQAYDRGRYEMFGAGAVAP